MAGERILIVDDDKAVLRSLRKLLELQGYSVETAKTGKEATKKMEKHFCLVALLDIKLPDTEGTELLDVMRKISPRTAKIMLTGYATLENAVKSLNKGADARAQISVKIKKEKSGKNQAREQFDNKISRRNRRSAISAFGAQNQPRNQRYVVIKTNSTLTFRAGRRRLYQ